MSFGPIQVIQQVQQIQVYAMNPISQFSPFSFTATTDGQTVFGPLPTIPLSVITLGITGALQDPGKTVPDYTVDGLYITLSEGIGVGNTVYGMYQIS